MSDEPAARPPESGLVPPGGTARSAKGAVVIERRSRRPLLILVVIAGVGVLVVGGWSFVAAERRLRAFCAEVQPGSNWPALAMSAGSRGLKVVPPRDGRPALVTDNAAFGRYVCSIDVGGDGTVGIARYNFND